MESDCTLRGWNRKGPEFNNLLLLGREDNPPKVMTQGQGSWAAQVEGGLFFLQSQGSEPPCPEICVWGHFWSRGTCALEQTGWEW